MSANQLSRMATQLLAANGYSKWGRLKAEAKAAARADVLAHAIRCPFGGYSRKARARH